jgi:hypothetical protein
MKLVPFKLLLIFKAFVLIFLILVLPLVILFAFSTFPLPNIQFAVIIIIFAKQYFFFNEHTFRNDSRFRAQKEITKQTGKPPGKKLIGKRVDEYILARHVGTALNIFIVLFITIYFGRF